MKWLIFVMSGGLLTPDAEAKYFQYALNDDFSLVSIESENYLKETAGLYAIDIVHKGSSIGLLKDVKLGSSWRSSFGLLLADEYISVSTARSELSVGNRSFDLNEILSINARVEFFDVIPFVSLAYQYSNDRNNMTFGFVTGLKFLKLDKSQIAFGQVLGIELESRPEISGRLKQDVLNGLQQFYVLPVIDIKFSYFFN